MLPVISLMRRYNPKAALLWVTVAGPDERHLVGQCEMVGNNLLKGYIDRFGDSRVSSERHFVWMLERYSGFRSAGARQTHSNSRSGFAAREEHFQRSIYLESPSARWKRSIGLLYWAWWVISGILGMPSTLGQRSLTSRTHFLEQCRAFSLVFPLRWSGRSNIAVGFPTGRGPIGNPGTASSDPVERTKALSAPQHVLKGRTSKGIQS